MVEKIARKSNYDFKKLQLSAEQTALHFTVLYTINCTAQCIVGSNSADNGQLLPTFVQSLVHQRAETAPRSQTNDFERMGMFSKM